MPELIVEVRFEVDEDELANLERIVNDVGQSRVGLAITTPSGPDPKLASGGVGDATGGWGLNGRCG